MPVSANDPITRIAGANECVLPGKVGLVLPGGTQVLCARQSIGWYSTDDCPPLLDSGRVGDTLSLAGATLATLPDRYDGMSVPYTVDLATLAAPSSNVTCDKWANPRTNPIDSHRVTWLYQCAGGSQCPFPQIYSHSFSVLTAGTPAAGMGLDCSGVVWTDGAGANLAAVLICMGVDVTDATRTIWVPIGRIVFDLGLPLTQRTTNAVIP